jgi:putative ABC transport system ATP-binding protein
VSEPLVEALGLAKQYRMGGTAVRALTDASLQIEDGEFVAIVGRSGSGKSTLLSVLGLLERPDAGSYRLRGREVGGLDEDARAALRSREIGFVFQMASLLPRSSAEENVELPLIYAGVDAFERRRRTNLALERVELLHRRAHWPHQLSGGEQQRVAIARALVNEPALILADEPVGSLDRKTADAVMALFEGLNRDGRTILMVTHAADVAERAHRRITIDDGCTVDDDMHARRIAAPAPVEMTGP